MYIIMHHCPSATSFDVRAWFTLILSLVSLACVVGMPSPISPEATLTEQRPPTEWTAKVFFYQYQQISSHKEVVLEEVRNMHKHIEDKIKVSSLLKTGETVKVVFANEDPPMFFENWAGFRIEWRNGEEEEVKRSDGVLKFMAHFQMDPPYEVELDSKYKPIERDPKIGKPRRS
ncbi:hypothetical protein GGU10DRAFT_113451 [Lentinula aff. detonsa]|uniref:Uncharacterized protein n=1 Tax=Lentinula aff. detonsa TaxID=2804958 RepID=A0AA38L3A1_9AGAR|nr:hypothetical protein GGU10DRAFT_113451 [Lentinula aff. detonsa]